MEASFVPRQDQQQQQRSSSKGEDDPSKPRQIRSQIKRTPASRGGPSPAMRKVMSAPNHQVLNSSNGNQSDNYDADESDTEDLSTEYHHVVLQLLDLMHTLHTRYVIFVK